MAITILAVAGIWTDDLQNEIHKPRIHKSLEWLDHSTTRPRRNHPVVEYNANEVGSLLPVASAMGRSQREVGFPLARLLFLQGRARLAGGGRLGYL